MTEKQIEKIKLSIKKQRAALSAEKRLYGGFDDSVGRRYHISDLYLRIGDYKGAIIYKKWFDKNFPNDIGSPILSMNWAIAFFELDKLPDATIYTIDTAFQTIYRHELLLDREVKPIDMYGQGLDYLEYTQSMIKHCSKIVTKPYLDWLRTFVETDEYKVLINRFIALNKLLQDETDNKQRIALLDHIRELERTNKNRNHDQ